MNPDEQLDMIEMNLDHIEAEHKRIRDGLTHGLLAPQGLIDELIHRIGWELRELDRIIHAEDLK